MFGASKNDTLLGVDISNSGIKVVELQNIKGSHRLQTYGYAETKSVSGHDPFENISASAQVLKNTVQTMSAKAKRAIASISMSRVFSSIINVPLVSDKEIEGYVTLQAQKLVSAPIGEVQLDWKVLDRIEAEKAKRKSLRVLITGARREDIKKYAEIFRIAGLELSSLEPEAFALIRSLIGGDQSTIMLIDIGASQTNVSIVEKGVPVMNRSVSIGGINITNELGKILAVPPEEAELMKRDITVSGNRNQSGLPKAVLTTLEPIIQDIDYLFHQFHEDQNAVNGAGIEKVILTGGTSILPNLSEYLTERLKVNIYRGDPWNRIAFAESLAPVLDEIGPRFAVAVGLAIVE